MDQKEREIRQRLTAKLEEAKTLMSEGKMDEARAAKDEASQIKQELDLHLEVRSLEPPTPGGAGNPAAPNAPPVIEIDSQRSAGEQADAEYRRVFIKALRNHRLTAEEETMIEERAREFRAVSGLTAEGGGMIIPEDILTKIEQYKREFVSLEQYVYVEPVTARSGSRVLEKNADITPFAEIDELGEIGEVDGPKFSKLTYAIKDRGGILPISNTMIADTDQNIMNYVAKWIAKKSVVTRNVLILAKLAALTKKNVAGIDDIKDIMNVDLDPAIFASSSCAVFTNQDGYNYLDKLKDGDGKYILQPDPTQPKRKMINGVPVIILGNRFLKTVVDEATGEKKAPLIIGDLKEAIVLFDRQQYEITSTNIGGKAFQRNTTDCRVIQREDVVTWDNEAAIYGQLVISAPAVAEDPAA